MIHVRWRIVIASIDRMYLPNIVTQLLYSRLHSVIFERLLNHDIMMCRGGALYGGPSSRLITSFGRTVFPFHGLARRSAPYSRS